MSIRRCFPIRAELVEKSREADIVAKGDDDPSPVVICVEGRRVVRLIRSDEGFDCVVPLRLQVWRESPLKPRMSCDGEDAVADEDRGVRRCWVVGRAVGMAVTRRKVVNALLVQHDESSENVRVGAGPRRLTFDWGRCIPWTACCRRCI